MQEIQNPSSIKLKQPVTAGHMYEPNVACKPYNN